MANKTLKATVKLDTKSAEASLTRLANKINKVQTAINKTSNNHTKLTTAINKAVTSTNKLESAAKKVNNANEKAANSARKMRDNYNSSNTAASRLLRTMKSLAGTYIGIMGMRAITNSADTITSAENRLNNLPDGNAELTKLSMDKIYSAAQRSRSGYGNMLSNVSKTMTLAGDAFQDNIDNAIRFQEIMAKSYSIGGASAAEQASSMYQLVQALGSGILQGDELRSVREGAPIAYKAIEEFAQGVLKTDESLKELASQGKITSDLVVAAIMDAEEQINKSFENTKMTFAQSWEIIKNMALQAFRPVLQMFNDLLNSSFGKAIINGLGYAFVFLANTILWVGDVLGKFFNWCAENWNWLQYVVIFALAAIATYLIYTTAIAIAQAAIRIGLWIAEHWQILLIILTIAALVSALIWLANTTADGCEFMIKALALVGLAILLIGLITGNTAIIIVGIVAMLAALFIMFAEEIIGGAFWCGAAICNTIIGAANVFEACCNWLSVLWNNTIAGIVNVGHGLWNSMRAIAQNIGIAFENGWIHAQNAFWSFVSAVLQGVKWLEPAINAVAQAFGKDGVNISGLISDISGKRQSTKSYVSVSDAWNSGMNSKSYQSFGDAWSSGMNTYDYLDLNNAYNKGAQIGSNLQNTVGGLGSTIKDKLSGLNFDGFDKLTGELGMGIGDPASGSYLPNINDPAYGLGAYDPSGVLDSLGSIDDNTDSIKDSMDLSNDDLEFLRKIADMEWRNEFTTAEIKVDMTNNNTVTAERDLDGIVEYLSDVLRAEMTNVAYGVHY
jgi:tape measure domain-containing protein